jgi:ABC-type transport system involved in multi-copper enzyme maturation permease subunit
MMSNPIFNREFKAMTRSWRLHAFAVALVLILSSILAVLWPRAGVFSRFDSQEMFTVFLVTNLALLIVTVPAFTATSITDERERGSFDLLFTTLLSPLDIMLGKMASAAVIGLVLVGLTLPVSAVCALSGGISVRFLVQMYEILVVMVITYGLVGLAVSSLCNRNISAVIGTYFAVGFLAGAVWLPSVLLPQFTQLGPAWRFIRALSPFEALLALYDPALYEVKWGAQSAMGAFHNHLMGMGAIAVLSFLVFSTNLMRSRGRRRGKSQEHYTDLRTGLKRKLGFPFYLIDPLKRKKPIGRLRNPVFVAELRSKVFGHPKFILRALSICIVLSLAILFLVCLRYGTFFSEDTVRLAAALFQFGVIVFFAPVVSAGSITGERSGGTLLLLRMTPLSSWTVVLGKLKAAFVYVFIFLLSSIPVVLALAYLETGDEKWRLIAWSGVFVLATLVFTLFGLFASSVMKSTVGATILSYGFALATSGVTLAVLVFGERIGMQVKAWFLVFNPLVAAIQLCTDRWFADMPNVYGVPIWQANLVFFAITFVVLLMLTSIRVWSIMSRRD